MNNHNLNIAVIGLGYVGLPLVVELSKHFRVIGFDTSEKRINELKNSIDVTLELEKEFLESANSSGSILFSSNEDDISKANFYIVTVPTPIDIFKVPDLSPITKATEMIGRHLSSGDVVVYESTVYPGVTEEVCAPILERESGLIFNEGFFCGYSPERINPGDRKHTLTSIVKIVSGSNPSTTNLIDRVYNKIIAAGTYPVNSIKVAEAAKVIENIQRDVNIALINELAMIFQDLGIDTKDVLKASSTKWNFLPFHPGLVGGHCIGVDPYYLTYKAHSMGINPELILAGRRINDSMPRFVANLIIKLLIKTGINIKSSRLLIYGITFKPNCPDTRNTKVVDLIQELSSFGCSVDVVDPYADIETVKQEYNIDIKSLNSIKKDAYDCFVYAVDHLAFKDVYFNYEEELVFDVTCSLPNCPNTI